MSTFTRTRQMTINRQRPKQLLTKKSSSLDDQKINQLLKRVNNENERTKSNIYTCEKILIRMQDINNDIQRNYFQIDRFEDYQYAGLTDEQYILQKEKDKQKKIQQEINEKQNKEVEQLKIQEEKKYCAKTLHKKRIDPFSSEEIKKKSMIFQHFGLKKNNNCSMNSSANSKRSMSTSGGSNKKNSTQTITQQQSQQPNKKVLIRKSNKPIFKIPKI